MKITKINIKNFRSIENVVIEPELVMCLVGENNAGKSNILKAIDFLLGESYPTSIPKENIFNNDESLEVDIQLYFDLSDDERSELTALRRNRPSNIIGIRFWKQASSGDGNQNPNELYQYRLITDSADETYRYEYVSASMRNVLGITYISSNRDIERHLGYSSKWTFMSKLALKFEQELEWMEKSSNEKGETGLKSQIQSTFNIVEGQFKQVQRFSNFDASLSKYFTDHLPTGAEESRFDISVNFKAFNPITYFKSLNLVPTDDGVNVDLSQLGDGMKTILLISYFKAYAEAFKNSSIIMIEEPELYLHPHLRRHIFDMFRDLADKNQVQIFYTTHSSDFIEAPAFEQIVLVRKINKKTLIKQAKCTEDITDSSNLLGYISRLVQHLGRKEMPSKLSITSRLRLFYRLEQNEAFFAKKVVLVEGETEIFTLPIYALALGHSFNKQGIVVVNCGSKHNIPYFYHLFSDCFNLPTFVIFDGDKQAIIKSGTNKDGAKWNIYLQKTLGIANPSEVLEKDEITDTYGIFSEDFETFIRTELNDNAFYEDQTSMANRIYGGGSNHKWFVQRYLAQKIIETQPFKSDSAFVNLKKLIARVFSV